MTPSNCRPYKQRSIASIIIRHLFGIIGFLTLLVILKILTLYIANVPFKLFVNFLYDNIWLILVFTVLFLIGEVFHAFLFPINLPAPLFTALGSVFLVSFIFQLLYYVDQITGRIFAVLKPLEPLIYLIIFIIIIVVEYVEIFSEFVCRAATTPPPQTYPSEPPSSAVTLSTEEGEMPRQKTWEDIGSEFRGLLYDIIHKIRESITQKRD